jgi:hypothetical protein
MGIFGKRSPKKDPLTPERVHSATIVTHDEEAQIVAAIAVALQLYTYRASVIEEQIITIQKVIRPYSPWSSKIYNMKQMPQRTPRKFFK